jgi:hypothetical protein
LIVNPYVFMESASLLQRYAPREKDNSIFVSLC